MWDGKQTLFPSLTSILRAAASNSLAHMTIMSPLIFVSFLGDLGGNCKLAHFMWALT